MALSLVERAGSKAKSFARHIRRILAAHREKGAAALAHGNRGKSLTMP